MAIAADQGGYFTAAQAVSIGYSYQAQKFHVDHGNWQRVDRGLFRIPEWPTDDDDSFVRWTVWSGGLAADARGLLDAAASLGARSELGVERALAALAERR